MPLVSVERRDRVAVVTIDNPPVNALSHAVRAALWEIFESLDADDAVGAVVLIGQGRFFIAGADISEFGKPPMEPILTDLVSHIEATSKPVVAAIHGAALGGGLEIALGCHARIAAPKTQFAFPEVGLGILPGAGGTQRAPRIAGLDAALDLITTTRRIDANEARDLGLVDQVVDGPNALDAAIFEANRLIEEGGEPRRVGEIAMGRDGADEILDRYRAKVDGSKGGQFAVARAIEAVAAAVGSNLGDGLKRERELIGECMASDERSALVHAFFSERRASKVPEADGGTAVPLKTTGVIGGGTMGAGIAAAMLMAGLKTVMIERDAAAVAAGRDRVEGILDGAVKRGKMSADRKAELMQDAFLADQNYAALADADLVVEAVFEDMAVKKAVFTELDAACRPGAVLATNTSYLDVNEIAAVTDRPESVVGLHFFSPAHIMKLLEIVVADRTGPDAVASGLALGKKLKKVSVRAGVCDGFIGNRILAHYRHCADMMMLDGASPYQIDTAMLEFGFAMGPYKVADLAGLDIGWATRKRKAATRDNRLRYVDILDRVCERGWFGRKTGRGVYRYDEGDKAGSPDPEIEALIDAARTEAGVEPRAFTAEEIQRRYMAAMINESAKVVAEGIAQRPSDVDITFLYGYGFPRWRGGPLKHADLVGLDTVLDDIRRYAEEDAFFWQPAPLLEELVAKGADFDSLNG